MNFKYLAKKYDTPLYVYDFNYFGEQFNKLKKVFKARKSIIAYAVKANSNLSVINHFASLGSGADCVSIGEVKRALLAGINKYKIIFSGVGKRDDEIKESLEKDILMLNIESEAELKRIEEIAKNLGKVARISIRVNPNIDPKTHPYISTGLHENKFGVDIETAKKLYIYAKKSENLNPIGIHFHIGSQLTELEPIKEASHIVADLVRSLKAINIDIKFFDVGGGLGIRYKDEELIEPYDYAQAILSTLNGLDVTIICEPGRFLVGNGGWFLTKVLYEKTNSDKRFVIVDGAMNDLIRPSLYGAYHKIEVLNENKEKSKANIVGPICESGDFFAKDMEIAKTDPGDLVLIHSAGAYGFSMSSNYNTRPRAAEVAVINGKDRLIRRRETFEDLIACEIDYLKK
ncbi:diaminopimelate decarboxylase [Lebetimonas sp. JS138]|uniref:diaminopimelate decarboxylase n=1 Tax=Lebetimonas sp. JS138 TaxID=990072 RepID=UPI0004634F9D|nr:diaminopimelate decarboxylase [Lebetimonas sp. JS138]